MTTGIINTGQELTDDILIWESIEPNGDTLRKELDTIHQELDTKADKENVEIALSGKASNPNLLDNWYFLNPINQRGEKKYTGIGYTIDRWKCLAALTVTLTSAGLQLSRDGASGTSIQQFFELDALPFDTTFTLSILYSDNTLRTATGKSPIQTTSSNQSFCMIDGSNTMWLYPSGMWGCNIGCYEDKTTKTVIAVKLELGSTQTLARFDNATQTWILNDLPPNPTTELLKCQQYFVRYDSNFTIFANGYAYASNGISASIKLPVAMRANPTVSYENIYIANGAHNASNAIVVTSITGGNGGTIGFYSSTMICENGSLTTGELAVLQIRNNGWIEFDANL